jgi:hypothetical protein
VNPGWTVFTGPEQQEGVRAATLSIEGGCLVFRDENGKITVAYSATSWTGVCEEDE